MLTKKENLKGEVKASKNAKNSPASNSENHAQNNLTNTISPAKTGSQPPAKASNSTTAPKQDSQASEKKASFKTKVTIKYDVGFPNQLFIRGKGANLNWDKGQPLKNVKPDEWVWETDTHFTHCEFKVLINDRIYENGDNHHLNAGSNLLYTPHFY